MPRPPTERRLGTDYETGWARRYPARLARAVIFDDVVRPLVHALTRPSVHGLDRIAGVRPPVIFAANHHSHLDTPLVLTALPARWRHRTVVAAAADYFFTTRARSAVNALTIAAIPMERARVGRRSADLAASLLGEGWSLLIFPEGGRSPHGWGQSFRGGAAYLSLRTDRPVVPIYVEGTRRVLKRGARRPTPARRGDGVHLVFGSPLVAAPGEDSRRLAARIEQAVARLGDEWDTDWWSASRRAARGATTPLTGPVASEWRRTWALGRDERPPRTPRWPSLSSR